MSVRQDLTAEALQALGFRPIHAGDDYDLTITVQINGVAVDLTGAVAWFTVKEDAIDTDANAKLAYKSDQVTEIEFTDLINGVMKIYFREPTTKDLEGLWPYDLQVKISSGTIITVGRGDIEFLANLTREIA